MGIYSYVAETYLVYCSRHTLVYAVARTLFTVRRYVAEPQKRLECKSIYRVSRLKAAILRLLHRIVVRCLVPKPDAHLGQPKPHRS